MTGNIRLFRKIALREAFEAGRKSALADPHELKAIFDAGEKKGAAWLNEAVNARSFMEIMAERRSESPGDFDSFMNVNEKRLCIPIIQGMFNDEIDDMDIVFVKGTKEITLDAIEQAVSEAFKIQKETLQNNRRRLKEIKTPRYFCYYLAYFHVRDGLKEIGQKWGKKHHATVIHGAQQISNDASLYSSDRDLLTDAYVWLIKNGYNTDNIWQDSEKRRKVEFINLDI